MTFPTAEHIAAAQQAADRVKALTGFYCWPSATLAQALIESASWTRLSGKNNGFGVKATIAQREAGKATLRTTKEVIGGKEVKIDAWFADYDSLEEAYQAHAMLFVRVGVYKDGLTAKTAKDFVRAIGPHYATAPTYAATIINVMDRLKLEQYDKPAATPAPVPSPAPNPAPVGWFTRFLNWLFGRKSP